MTPLLIAFTGLLALLLPVTALAQSFANVYAARYMESVNPLCTVLPCNWVGMGSQGLSMYVFSKIILTLEIGIIAAAIVCLFIAAAQMVFSSTEESSVKDAKSAYIYIITGLAIIGMSHLFVNAFSPGTFAPAAGFQGGAGANLVNTVAIGTGVTNVISYIKLIIALSLLVNIVLQSFRLINSQGEDEQTKKAKGRLISGFIGAGIIMLANAIVSAVAPNFLGGGPSIFIVEIAGIANYMLMILGFLAVMTIFIAGILLVVSFDESLKDKAKSMIKTSVIALIVVLMSFALVQAFILL